MFKKITPFVLLLFMIQSCTKKTVTLPIVPISGITGIANYSQIWVFTDYEASKLKADINKNNTISSTHWIINMDKRLPMLEIIPVLEMIKANRDKKSIHSVEGMNTYLSYANSKDKNISLYEIDSTQYLILDQISYNDLLKHYKSELNFYISEKSFSINEKTYQSSRFTKSLLDSLPNKPIHFFMDGSISYQTYMDKRIKLKEYVNQEFEIDQTEYIIKK